LLLRGQEAKNRLTVPLGSATLFKKADSEWQFHIITVPISPHVLHGPGNPFGWKDAPLSVLSTVELNPRAGIQDIEIYLTGDIPLTLFLNYPEFPDSCLRV
jgi:hypothetical protein